VTDRTLTPGSLEAAAEDIRDHEYAIVQTRIERVPSQLRTVQCTDLASGCSESATLVTLALAEITDEPGGAVGFAFARHGGSILRIPTCEAHRCEASHELYFVLTGRTRPDGIRAFDVVGHHMNWL